MCVSVLMVVTMFVAVTVVMRVTLRLSRPSGCDITNTGESYMYFAMFNYLHCFCNYYL